MWTCKACQVNFTFESVEEHLYWNHLTIKKSSSEQMILYVCGECGFFAERFQDISVHCILVGHRPTAVTKGPQFAEYIPELFIELESIMMSMEDDFNSPPSMTQEAPVSQLLRQYRPPDDETIKHRAESTTSIMSTVSDGKNVAAEEGDGTGMVENLETIINFVTVQSSTSTTSHRLVNDFPSKESEENDDEMPVSTEESGTNISESEGSFDSQQEDSIANDSMSNPSEGEENEASPNNIVFTHEPPQKPAYFTQNSPQNPALKLIPVAMGDVTIEQSKLSTASDESKVVTKVGKKPGRSKAGQRQNSNVLTQRPECPKTFEQKHSLIRHQMAHRGERPYPCPSCPKAFVHRGDLKLHQRCHTRERPYACTNCGRRFAQSSNLIAHRRLHSGERPYRCAVCGQAYSDPSNFRRHKEKHEKYMLKRKV